MKSYEISTMACFLSGLMCSVPITKRKPNTLVWSLTCGRTLKSRYQWNKLRKKTPKTSAFQKKKRKGRFHNALYTPLPQKSLVVYLFIFLWSWVRSQLKLPTDTQILDTDTQSWKEIVIRYTYVSLFLLFFYLYEMFRCNKNVISNKIVILFHARLLTGKRFG